MEANEFSRAGMYPREARASLSDDISELEPPDPIPNSVVKRLSADGSVGSPHVRVGHRQAFNIKPRFERVGVFYCFALVILTLPCMARHVSA